MRQIRLPRYDLSEATRHSRQRMKVGGKAVQAISFFVRRIIISFAMAALALAQICTARADWLPDTTYICDDPLILRQQSFFLTWFPRPGSVVLTPLGQEKYQVEVNQKYLNDGTVALGRSFTSSIVELDDDRLKLMKFITGKRSNDSEIPFWVSGQLDVAAFILTSGESAVIKPIFKFVFALEKIEHARISMLETFLALGGQLIQTGRIDTLQDGRMLATETILYRVALGKETRNFLVYACAYPAAVVMRRVSTVFPPMNKLIFEGDKTDWVEKRADTQAVIEHLKKVREDNDFYYFTADRGDLRISRHGGPVERMRDGAWDAMYQKTQVE